jgi:hypothetical protein
MATLAATAASGRSVSGDAKARLLLLCSASGYVLSMKCAAGFPCSAEFRVRRRRT